MDTTDLIKLAKDNGLCPIPVNLSEDWHDSNSLPQFQGTLQQFWDAAKALEAKAVLIESWKMEESDFEREDDTGESDDDTISLLTLSPSLEKYRSFVGKEYTFLLVTKGGAAEIELTVTESWWDEFQEKADEAYDNWAAGQNDKTEEEEAVQAEANEKALKSLRGLIADSGFCQLRSFRSMLEYAIERIPELDDMDDYVIRPELQTLKAKIEAKGLNKKLKG
jgi:hypothetical protein